MIVTDQGNRIEKSMLKKIENLKYKVEDYVVYCLRNEDSLLYLENRYKGLYELLEGFCMREAKRIRPVLFLLTDEAYSNIENESVIHIATSIELMHTFALIHDDIIDQSPSRGKCPTLYQAINNVAEKSNKTVVNGTNLAMLLGDLIYNIALNEYNKVELEDSLKLKGMQLLLSTALTTAKGQMMELLKRSDTIAGISTTEMLRIYDLKTSYYTFCLPLKMGALINGQDEDEMNALHGIGLDLGKTFQILDDIDDYNPDNGYYIDYFSALLWKKADIKEKKVLKTVFSDTSAKNIENIKIIKQLFKKYAILHSAYDKSREFINSAYKKIENLNIKEKESEQLIKYFDFCLQERKL